MKKRRNVRRIILLLVVVLLVASAAIGGYAVYERQQAGGQAKATLDVMREVIPNFGVDTGAATGMGRDPLAALSIDEIDIIGALEIPSINLLAPVTAKGYEEEYFATWMDGSPVKGHFRIIGGRDDVFRKLSKVKPGAVVTFTDIDGIRYSYQVTTQFHLKNWDEADHDLMLCYETDSKTRFVVGCAMMAE